MAALVLGIVSFCLGFFAGIPAIICGHIAVSRIKRSQGTLKGQGMAVAGLVMGYFTIALGLAMVAVMGVPVLSDQHPHAKEQTCMARLTQISLAVFQYADEHDGQLPPDLQALLDVGDIESGTFICPSDETHSEEDSDDWHSSYDSVFDLTDETLTVDSLPANVMFLWEDEARHRYGRTAAFFDRKFNSLSEDEFQKELKRLKALVDDLE